MLGKSHTRAAVLQSSKGCYGGNRAKGPRTALPCISGTSELPMVHSAVVSCGGPSGQRGSVYPRASSVSVGNRSMCSVNAVVRIPPSVNPGTRIIIGAWVASSKFVCLQPNGPKHAQRVEKLVNRQEKNRRDGNANRRAKGTRCTRMLGIAAHTRTDRIGDKPPRTCTTRHARPAAIRGPPCSRNTDV